MRKYYNEAEVLQGKPRRTFLSPQSSSSIRTPPLSYVGGERPHAGGSPSRRHLITGDRRLQQISATSSVKAHSIRTPPLSPTRTQRGGEWPQSHRTPTLPSVVDRKKPPVSSVVQNLFERGEFEAGVLAVGYEATTALTLSTTNLPPPLDLDDDGFIANASVLFAEVESDAKHLATGIFAKEEDLPGGMPWWFVSSELQLEPLYFGARCYFSLRRYEGATLLLSVVYHSYRLMGRVASGPYIPVSSPSSLPVDNQPSTEAHKSYAPSAASLLGEVDDMLDEFSRSGMISLTPEKTRRGAQIESQRKSQAPFEEDTRTASPPSRVPIEEVSHYYKLAKRASGYRRDVASKDHPPVKDTETVRDSGVPSETYSSPQVRESPKVFGSGNSTRVKETMPAVILNSWIVASVIGFLVSGALFLYKLLVSYALVGLWTSAKEAKGRYDYYKLEAAKAEGYPRRPHWGLVRRVMKTQLVDVKVWHLVILLGLLVFAIAGGSTHVLLRLALPLPSWVEERAPSVWHNSVSPNLSIISQPFEYLLFDLPYSAVDTVSTTYHSSWQRISQAAIINVCYFIPFMSEWMDSCHPPPTTFERAAETLKEFSDGTKILLAHRIYSPGEEFLKKWGIVYPFWSSEDLTTKTPMQVGEGFRSSAVLNRQRNKDDSESGGEETCDAAEYYWSLFIRLCFQSSPLESYRDRSHGVMW